MTRTGLPDVVFAASLAMLADMTPARLARLLGHEPAFVVYDQLCRREPGLVRRLAGVPTPTSATPDPPAGLDGRLSQVARLLARWSEELGSRRVAETWERIRRSGAQVARRGGPGYPRRLLRLRLPPEVLWIRGDLGVADRPCVGLVGTRRATHYGAEVARELGFALAQGGVTVVSGLARGIDAAAHGGVLAAIDASPGSSGHMGRPVGVSGGGVDVVYPVSSRRLFDRAAADGAVISEAPLGVEPAGWRFPMRNRIIAALS
ncbi:MAG: DNA-processing protein DprA, partial [Acidimicrobiales bacterium]